jgi:hypothetical protein
VGHSVVASGPLWAGLRAPRVQCATLRGTRWGGPAVHALKGGGWRLIAHVSDEGRRHLGSVAMRAGRKQGRGVRGP